MISTLGLIFLFLLTDAFLAQVFSFPFPIWDPLLVIVVREAFFGGFDARRYLGMAFLCGVIADTRGADTFGLQIFSYLACALIFAQAARFLTREERRLFLPAVALAVFLNQHVILAAKTILMARGASFHYGVFFIKVLTEAAGSTAAAVLLERKRASCALDSTA